MQLLKKCRVRDVKSKETWKSKIGRVKFICFIRKPKNKTHEQQKKKTMTEGTNRIHKRMELNQSYQ